MVGVTDNHAVGFVCKIIGIAVFFRKVALFTVRGYYDSIVGAVFERYLLQPFDQG